MAIKAHKNRADMIAWAKLFVGYVGDVASVTGGYPPTSRLWAALYLWKDNEAMLRNVTDGSADEWARCAFPDLRYRFRRGRERLVNRKIAELHFVSGLWDLEVVSHEAGHLWLELLRRGDGSAPLGPGIQAVMDQEGEAEEHACYRLGWMVEDVYNWLLEADREAVRRKLADALEQHRAEG